MSSLHAALLILAVAACAHADQAADVDNQLQTLMQVGQKTMQSWQDEDPSKVQSEYSQIFGDHGPAVLPDKPPKIQHAPVAHGPTLKEKYAAEQKKIAQNKVRKLALKIQKREEVNKGLSLAKKMLGSNIGKEATKELSDMKVPEMPPHVDTPEEIKAKKRKEVKQGLALAKKLLQPSKETPIQEIPVPSKLRKLNAKTVQPVRKNPPQVATPTVSLARNTPMTVAVKPPRPAARVKPPRPAARVKPPKPLGIGHGVKIVPRNNVVDDDGHNARTIPPTIQLPGVDMAMPFEEQVRIADAERARRKKAEALEAAKRHKAEQAAFAAEQKREAAMSDKEWAMAMHQRVLNNPVFKEAREAGRLKKDPVHYRHHDTSSDDEEGSGITSILKAGGLGKHIKEGYLPIKDWNWH